MAEEPEFAAAMLSKAATNIVEAVLEGAIAHGLVNTTGKSEAQLQQEFIDIFSSDHHESHFLFAIDHTPTLRKLGRKFQNSGQVGLAAMFYATWVEHVLNDLITISVSRRGWSDERAKQIIRDSSIHAKMSWLLPLLGHPEIPKTLTTRLGKLAEMRNQFVHYKWNYKNASVDHSPTHGDAKFLESCIPSLTYLARYKTKVYLPVPRAMVKRLATPSKTSSIKD